MFGLKKNKNSTNKYRNDKREKSSQEVFTYFIPAPPVRLTGYREKDFDNICKTIISHGLDFKIIKTIPHPNGIWIISTIKGEQESIDLLFRDSRLKDLSITSEIDVQDEFQNMIERE